MNMKLYQTKAGKVVSEVHVLCRDDIFDPQYLWYGSADGMWCVSRLDISHEVRDIPIKLFRLAAQLPPPDTDDGYKREHIIPVLESMGYEPDDFFDWWMEGSLQSFFPRLTILEYLEVKEFAK